MARTIFDAIVKSNACTTCGGRGWDWEWDCDGSKTTRLCPDCQPSTPNELARAALAREFGRDAQRQQKRPAMRAPR